MGELGWELHVPTDCMVHVYETLMKAGAEFDAKACGYYAIDSLRIESGYRAFAHELTRDENVTTICYGQTMATKNFS